MHNAVENTPRRYSQYGVDRIYTTYPWGVYNLHIEVPPYQFDSEVSANNTCGSHVHISRVQGSSLNDLYPQKDMLKRDSFTSNSILKEHTRREPFEQARSNWMDNETPGLWDFP